MARPPQMAPRKLVKYSSLNDDSLAGNVLFPNSAATLCRGNRRHYIRMPRYHFHIVDGGVLDTLGATLPTDEAARVHAEKMAHRFTRAEVGKLRAKAVKVTGETGATLFLVPIRHDARTES